MLAAFCDHLVRIGGGKICCGADRLAAGLPATAWTPPQRRRRVEGLRFYDWNWLADVGAEGDPDDGRHSLLICRNNTIDERLLPLLGHPVRPASPTRG